jgi:hypothetical protein
MNIEEIQKELFSHKYNRVKNKHWWRKQKLKGNKDNFVSGLSRCTGIEKRVVS